MLPATGADTSEARGDIDGDGTPDRITVFSAGGAWIARVESVEGETAAVLGRDDGSAMGAAIVLGASDLDGNGRDEIVVSPGQSAVGRYVAYFVYDTCHLTSIESDGGGPALNHVSARARLADGIRCWSDLNGARLVSRYFAERADAPPATEPFQWTVGRTDFRLVGTKLVQVGDPVDLGLKDPSDDAVLMAMTVTCSGVEPDRARA